MSYGQHPARFESPASDRVVLTQAGPWTLGGLRVSRPMRGRIGGRPFMHRRADVVRSVIGLAVLIICGAVVHGRLLTSAESTVFLFVNGWPDWLYRSMW